MNPEQNFNASPPAKPTHTGFLRVAKEHANACWNTLVKHAQVGNCTCHQDAHGFVHVLSGCATGVMLYEEYSIVVDRVHELLVVEAALNIPLEYGDMGSTIDPSYTDEHDAADRAAEMPFT